MDRTEALALLTRYYAAFNAGDWEGMLDCLDDGVIHDINQGSREIGKDAFRAFMDRMNRNYKEQLVDMAIMTNEDGTRAAAEFVIHGEYLKTDPSLPEARGQRYVIPVGAFFEVREGKIARVTNYYNLAEWSRQVSGG